MYVSEKLPTYPSPNLTLTLTSPLHVGLGRGRWAVCQTHTLIQGFHYLTGSETEVQGLDEHEKAEQHKSDDKQYVLFMTFTKKAFQWEKIHCN